VNGTEFLAAVYSATGLRVRILDGDEEALLSYRSAQAHFGLADGRSVVVDIGGGSLELVLSAGGLIDDLISLPYGAIRLTDQFLSATSTRGALRELRRTVRRGLRERVSRKSWHGATIIGSGGTFTNLAAMVLARQKLTQSPNVHGAYVPRAVLEQIIDLLQGMSAQERQAVPGLSPARADIILAGLAVAAEVMALLDVRGLTVSAYGIREGLLLESAQVTPLVADVGTARARSIMQLAERSHYEVPHAHHVQTLALQIFDSVAKQLALTANDRQLLADAALLHDIGYHISFDDHHKHSYHLIIHAELSGMTPAERVIVANVARYHRGPEPRPSHKPYWSLAKPLRRRIKRLAAILRVADGLDRGHSGTVAEVRAEWIDGTVRVLAIPAHHTESMRLELWGAERKAGLLSRVLNTPVEIVGMRQAQ
jgi:exopolyphosphatase/guanosine-5'-triphosphate,3'-diphosphate pyrophosphatase